jgi:excisionase family DNA binding protein
MSPHVRKVRENRSTIGALTIAEIADELRVSESSVLRLVRSRRLRAISVGERKLIILREDLLKFLQGSGATA